MAQINKETSIPVVIYTMWENHRQNFELGNFELLGISQYQLITRYNLTMKSSMLCCVRKWQVIEDVTENLWQRKRCFCMKLLFQFHWFSVYRFRSYQRSSGSSVLNNSMINPRMVHLKLNPGPLPFHPESKMPKRKNKIQFNTKVLYSRLNFSRNQKRCF